MKFINLDKNIIYKTYKKILYIYFFTRVEYECISFPKSGRTWVRFFMGKYYEHKYKVPFTMEFIKKMHESIPRIIFTHRNFLYKNREAPLSKNNLIDKKKKVLFLFRDPKDVVISFYFHTQKRQEFLDERKLTLSQFVRHDLFGVRHIIKYMNMVYENRNNFASFEMVSYESLQEKPSEAFSKILLFLGESDINQDSFRFAIQESGFENMKQLEISGDVQDERLMPGDKDDPDSFKVRKGKIGGYKDYLSAKDILFIEEQMKYLNPVFSSYK